MKKWLVTRVSYSTIEVESDVEPLTEDKWDFECNHAKEFDEAYSDDGIVDWEVRELG